MLPDEVHEDLGTRLETYPLMVQDSTGAQGAKLGYAGSLAVHTEFEMETPGFRLS